MPWQYIVTLVAACVGSAGIFNLIQFLITRKDTRFNSISEITAELRGIRGDLGQLKADILQNKVEDARIRILRAADEIQHSDAKHSEEYFNQLNSDITFYNNYCRTHSDFVNNKASHAIQFINSVYQKALRDDDFL